MTTNIELIEVKNQDDMNVSSFENDEVLPPSTTAAAEPIHQISFSRYLWSVIIIFISWFSILSFPLPIIISNDSITNFLISKIFNHISSY